MIADRIVPTAALLLLALAVAPTTRREASAASSPTFALDDADALEGLEVEVASLPVELHRRAVDLLELGRTRRGSTWADARLSPWALPMVRPGDDAPTYYELRVEGPDGSPRGYFVLSTGDHDHPVPISVDAGPARSRQLLAALGRRRDVARVNFLSPVALVAESSSGARLAQVGPLPPKVLRADAAWLDEPEAMHTGHAVWSRTPDGEAIADEHVPEHRVELGTWSSWQQLRREYPSNYAVPHEVMRRAAADDWADERTFRERGEGLQSGWFREIPLLPRGGATIEVQGEGRDLVQVQRIERPFEGDEAVAIFVPPIEREGVFEVDVHVGYGDGSSEVHRFQVTREIPRAALGSAAPAALPSTPRAELGALPHAPLAAPVSGVPAPECDKVVIRSTWDSYVYARNGGGGPLEARGGWIGDWEIFAIEPAGSHDQIALRARNGKYVQAVGSTVDANASAPTGTAVFRRFKYADGTVAFRTSTFNYLRSNQDGTVDAGASAAGPWEKHTLEYCSPSRLDSAWAGNDPIDAWKKVRKYDQLQGRQAPNRGDCASGCGATVWAMIFAWGDHMAALGDERWSASGGLYRRDGTKAGVDEPAPEWMWKDMPALLTSSRSDDQLHRGVGNMIEEIRTYIDDDVVSGCTMDGGRFTAPHIMAQAYEYVRVRHVPAKLTAQYDGASIMTNAGKQNALRPIREHRQVVGIGIGYFSHYPTAFGWEDAKFASWDAGLERWADRSRQARFVVHMGWPSAGSANVPFDSWFAGFLTPDPVLKAATTVSGSAPAAVPSQPSTTLPTATTKPGVAPPTTGSKLPGPVKVPPLGK